MNETEKPMFLDVVAEAGRRLSSLKSQAMTIRRMFAEPWDDRFNTRIWDAQFVLDNGEIVIAMLVQRNEGLPNIPKYQASVTPRYGDESSEVKNFADSDATPEMLAFFMRLDRVLDGYQPEWKLRKQTASSNLAVMRGNLTDRRLH